MLKALQWKLVERGLANFPLEGEPDGWQTGMVEPPPLNSDGWLHEPRLEEDGRGKGGPTVSNKSLPKGDSRPRAQWAATPPTQAGSQRQVNAQFEIKDVAALLDFGKAAFVPSHARLTIFAGLLDGGSKPRVMAQRRLELSAEQRAVGTITEFTEKRRSRRTGFARTWTVLVVVHGRLVAANDTPGRPATPAIIRCAAAVKVANRSAQL